MTTRPARGLLLAVLTCALLSIGGWGSPVAAADGPSGVVLPSSARPGDTVEVGSKGWPAGSQIQAVVCGDWAIGGSNTCYLPGAVLGRADDRGRVHLQLTVAAPPRPCPCVIRLTTFSGDAQAQNLPIDVIGHEVGTPPVADQPSSDLQLTSVTMQGSGSTLRRLLGLGGSAEVVVTVTNRGDAPATVPAVRVGLGDGELGDPQSSAVTVPPKQSRTVVLDVDLPVGSVGTQQATVAWAKDADARLSTSWSTYPWLLIGLVVTLLVLALLWLWWHRWGRARAAERRRRADEVAAYRLPDVVYVEEIGGLLVNPAALRGSRTLDRVRARISADDLVRLAAGGQIDLPTDDASRETSSTPHESDLRIFVEVGDESGRRTIQ